MLILTIFFMSNLWVWRYLMKVIHLLFSMFVCVCVCVCVLFFFLLIGADCRVIKQCYWFLNWFCLLLIYYICFKHSNYMLALFNYIQCRLLFNPIMSGVYKRNEAICESHHFWKCIDWVNPNLFTYKNMRVW